MFTPHTPEDKKQMLDRIGVKSFDELISVIPDKLRFKGKLDLPEPMSELEIIKHCSEIAAKNSNHFWVAVLMTIIFQRLLIISFYARNFIRHTRHIKPKFLRGLYRRFMNTSH
jgi:hypothetical protein